MPNGAIVFRQLSTCPPDALKAEQRDTALPNPVTTFKHPRTERLIVEPVAPGTPPRHTPTAPAKERNIIDEAYAVCVLLKLKGATTCQVEVNIFSDSFIDATVPAEPRAAQWVCLGIANETRQPGSPFVGQNWKLKLFSPYGDGSRPMAVCNL